MQLWMAGDARRAAQRVQLPCSAVGVWVVVEGIEQGGAGKGRTEGAHQAGGTSIGLRMHGMRHCMSWVRGVAHLDAERLATGQRSGAATEVYR